MNSNTYDKAGKEYWESIWTDAEVPEIADPDKPGIKNVTIRLMEKHLRKAVADLDAHNSELIEVGCGNSIWLPYFAKRLGFNVTGLDYSESGCEHARRILRAADVNGKVVNADFFDPPENVVEKFDVLTSFGVVEHFVPTEGCLKAFNRFLKPNGRIITTIPNLEGLNGYLTKTTNEPLYDKHISLSREKLAEAHTKAGFKVIDCRYIFTVNFNIPNTAGLDPSLTATKLKEVFLRNLGRFSMLALALGEKLNAEITTEFLSPYILCVAEKSE